MASEIPLSQGDPISTLVAKCFRSFDDLECNISDVSDGSTRQLDEELVDELGRLRVWAANIGAHRTGRMSLDFRLRDAPHIKTRVQGLLRDLSGNIQRTRDIISGASLPWDKIQFESDSDDESSDSETDDESLEGTELEQLQKSIHETITLLSRLSMAVRNPAMHDRHINSAQAVAVAFSKYDMDHVSNKFPQAPREVTDNLGKAISQRRQYLKFRKERHEKLAEGLQVVEGHEGPDSRSEARSESMAATSLPEMVKSMSQEDLEREQYSDSEASHTSFARSFMDDGERQKLPPLPREGADGTPFECPICFMMVSVRSQESWKRHVFRDILPYVCTFPDCPTPQRLFSKRREWFLHELQMHRCHWQCAHGCQQVFKTVSEFDEHVTAAHPESASPDLLASLRSASARPVSQRSLVDCSVCGEKDISLQGLERHLGRHQEDLALFAMPFMAEEPEENLSKEASSVEEQNSTKRFLSPVSTVSVDDDSRFGGPVTPTETPPAQNLFEQSSERNKDDQPAIASALAAGPSETFDPPTPEKLDFDIPVVPEEPSQRRSRRPPPIVTSTSNSRDATESLAETVSAYINNLAPPNDMETEEERQSRIERERTTGSEQLRREREERQEESCRMNEQSRNVDDWEARLEEGRRRMKQERTNRQPEERHDASIDAVAPADSSGDDDWEARLEKGRRRLADLRRTGEAATRNLDSTPQTPSDQPRRWNTNHLSPPIAQFPSSGATALPDSASYGIPQRIRAGYDSAHIDREAYERERLHAFERQQMDLERRLAGDKMLVAPMADTKANLNRAEARLATRRGRDYSESMVEGQDGSDMHERLNPSAPHPSDFYNPWVAVGELRNKNSRLPATTHEGESGPERGRRVINEARGGERRSRRSSVSYHQHLRHRRDEPRDDENEPKEHETEPGDQENKPEDHKEGSRS